jgi:hypothetical protein
MILACASSRLMHIAAASSMPKLVPGDKYDARITTQWTASDQAFDVIEILSKDGKQISKLDLSQVGGSRRFVYKRQWNRTGEFFIVSTSSIHSTWHTRTFVFGARMQKFIELDEYLRPIVGGDFVISEKNQLTVQIQNGVGLGSAPPLHVQIDLAELENVASKTKPMPQ